MSTEPVLVAAVIQAGIALAVSFGVRLYVVPVNKL